MEHPTFEQLPAMVALLLEKVAALELLIQSATHLSRPGEDLLSVDQAAEFLKLSVPTLYSKVSRGELPANKPGKRLYFKKSELQQWVDEGRKSTYNEIEAAANNFNHPGRLRHVRRVKKY